MTDLTDAIEIYSRRNDIEVCLEEQDGIVHFVLFDGDPGGDGEELAHIPPHLALKLAATLLSDYHELQAGVAAGEYKLVTEDGLTFYVTNRSAAIQAEKV